MSELLKSNSGFATLISFIALLMIMTTVMAVFSAVAVKSLTRARLDKFNLENVYAAESFLEDILRRIGDDNLADPEDKETFLVGDAEVTLAVSEDGRGRVYGLAAESQDKYFHQLELVTSTTTPIKVKSWQDSF